MNASAPVLSVVIPAFNRVEPLLLTLRSVGRAAESVPTEIILVDDGSEPPLSAALAGRIDLPIRWLRQTNQGSMAARQAGLAAARGDFVQFLDSDDLVHPEKFSRQIAALRASQAEISYTDMADYTLDAAGEPVFRPGDRLPVTADPLEFFLRVQPAPHNPIYRRDYLHRYLDHPLVPARREFDPVGDVWIYYNLILHPARLEKVAAPLTAAGIHEEDRYSRHWEKLGYAALRLVEAFSAACPRTAETLAARRAVGESAFNSWRRLPRDFDRGFDARLLAVWRAAPRGPLRNLGERRFQILARLCGPALAARLLRRWFGHTYASCRTLSEAEYHRLVGTP
jgi:hypothetical protein